MMFDYKNIKSESKFNFCRLDLLVFCMFSDCADEDHLMMFAVMNVVFKIKDDLDSFCYISENRY